MKSSVLGKNISVAEVSNISKFGIWICVENSEYFLSYKEYPWFKDAKVSEICNVQFFHSNHLCWKDLDVDLELESLKNPHQYPLAYK